MRFRRPSILGTILAIATTCVYSEEQERKTRILDDRFCVSLRAVFDTLSTDVASGRSLGLLVNLEDVLGFDEQVHTAALTGFYRFGQRRKHALAFTFGSFDRSGAVVATAKVPFFDVEFLGAVEAEFLNRLSTLDYQFSFVNNGKTEAGFTAGLSIYEFNLRIRGTVAVAGDPDVLQFVPKATDVVAPAPTIGFYINYAILKKLIFTTRGNFIELDVGNAAGQISTFHADLSWFFYRHLGLVVGINSSGIKYRRDKEGERLNIDYAQSGLTAGFTAVF